jgi:WD40 repeat protein
VPGTTDLAAASLGGIETVIFDTSQLGGLELGGWLAPVRTATADYSGDGDRVVVSDLFTSYLTADTIDGSGVRLLKGELPDLRVEVSRGGKFVASADPDGIWQVRKADTDEVIYQAPDGMVIRGVSADGSTALVHPLMGSAAPAAEFRECDPSLVSTVDGSIVTLTEGGCFRAFFSSDGRLVYTDTDTIDGQGVFDTATGELLGTSLLWPMGGFEAAFTPDGERLVLGTWRGPVLVFDVGTLLSGAAAEEAVLREIPAHDAGVLRVSMSPDGSMAATWAWTDPVKVWDLETGQLIGQFGAKIPSGVHRDGDFHPTLPQFVFATPPNEIRIYTLDIDELVTIAQAGLSRDMTEEECQQYFRRSCEDS